MTPEVMCQECGIAPYAVGMTLHDGLCCNCYTGPIPHKRPAPSWPTTPAVEASAPKGDA